MRVSGRAGGSVGPRLAAQTGDGAVDEAWSRHREEVLEGSTGRWWQGRRGELRNNFGEHREEWWQAQATIAMSSSNSVV
jgi:hypothetical protein